MSLVLFVCFFFVFGEGYFKTPRPCGVSHSLVLKKVGLPLGFPKKNLAREGPGSLSAWGTGEKGGQDPK